MIKKEERDDNYCFKCGDNLFLTCGNKKIHCKEGCYYQTDSVIHQFTQVAPPKRNTKKRIVTRSAYNPSAASSASNPSAASSASNPMLSPLIIDNSPTPPMSSSSSNPINPTESEDEPRRSYFEECMLLGKFTTSFYNILRTAHPQSSENYDLDNMFVGSTDDYNQSVVHYYIIMEMLLKIVLLNVILIVILH